MIERREFLTGAGALCACLLSRPARAVLAAAEEAAKPLPDYYNAHLNAVAAKVNALAERTVDGFWFITDLHIASNKRQSGKAIAALTAKTPSLRKTICGGDLPEAFGERYGTSKAGVDFAVDSYRLFWVEPIEASGQLVYTAKGNHDFTIRHDAKSQEGFTYPGEMARRIVMGSKGCANVVTNAADPEACYYYFDNGAAKIRYIVADTTDTIDPERPYWGVAYGMHGTQLRWLADNAIATIPDGWHAVVIHHVPITGCVAYGGETEMFAPFRRLLEAYQNRGTCTVGGKTYDFSSAKGRILMDLTGHCHAERQTFRNGILHVTEPCDAAYGDYILGSKPWCGDLPRKASGTVFEQTFDAVQLDPTRGLVHFTRVGGGQDRVIHTTPLEAKVGRPLQLAAPLLKGTLTWGCHDADRIVPTPNPKNRYNPFVSYVNDVGTIDGSGVFTAKKTGEAMVVAMDANLNKEIFPVRVSAEHPGRPLKFLFMTDHHVESDFIQGHGITKGEPDFTMWKPGNHAALVETYRFINEDPYCRDVDFALFGGDQINTGYDSHPQEMADEKVNYFRTLETLDVHARTKGAVSDMAFVAEPWLCKQNLGKGMKPYRVEPKPPASRVIAIQGNHDTGVAEFYRDCAFTAGDVRFITFFASYVGLPPPPGKRFHSTAKIYDETIAFIEKEMKAAAANPNIRHIVLCSHWAIAPAGKDFACPILDACKENKMNDNRRRLLDLCAKYGCDLYLNGHEHNGRYPVGRVGNLSDINCGTLSGNPKTGQGAFVIVEIHPGKALFNVYSRAAVEESDGHCTVTARPTRLFTREIGLAPIR